MWKIFERLFGKQRRLIHRPRITCECGKTVSKRQDGKPYRHKCVSGDQIADKLLAVHASTDVGLKTLADYDW